MKKLLVVLGLTALFSAAFVLVRDLRGARRQVTIAAPFSAASLAGGTLGPQSYEGKVVLVNFWATYCVPCVDEMPSLERVWKDYQGQGLVVLAVSIDDEVAPVQEFQKRFGLSFPLAHDPGKRIATSWGTEKVPETYLISRQGEVRARVMGAVDWNAPDMRQTIEAMLKEPA